MLWKISTVLLLLSISELSSSQDATQRDCDDLVIPNGITSCTRGAKKGSKCTFTCNEGFELTESSPKLKRCRCANNGCQWSGKDAICQSEQAGTDCPIPDYMRAQVGVLDSWPGGAILRINLKPEQDTNNGWSFVLKFSKAIPSEAKFDSGKAKLKERSDDGKIFKFWNQNFNSDISRYQLYSVFVNIRNLPEDMAPHSLIGLAGFYNSRQEGSLSCIGVPSPVEPISTASPIFTEPPVTPTEVPTSVATQAPTSVATQVPTSVGTQLPTSAGTLEPVAPTSKPTIDPGTNCTILDNDGDKPGYRILNPGWESGERFSFTGRAEAYADGEDLLNDWTFKLEFDTPVHEMEVYVGTPEKLHDGYVWLIHPKSFNQKFQTQLQILFMGHIDGGEFAPSMETTVTTFCRDGAEPTKDFDGTFERVESTTTPVILSTTIDPSLLFTRSTEDPSLGRCAENAVAGSLPPMSMQTDINVGYTPSPQHHQQLISDAVIDYNEVLHASLLFYEAQRSGKLPDDNRIPWRGDSGLSDGCDVGLDLTGGYYDAGDNVKFGFPMAWTITTVAWSAIEFDEAYTRAGLHDRVLEMIKWGTDYFMKAHPENDVLYVQVTDAKEDHSRWQRPEDATPTPNKSYKIDKSNSGSDVAAETAAALAAASLVFKNTDPDYSDLCLKHAEALFSFADKYRKVYHDSVPEVTDFYKSWSGYEDDLLWGLAWLYKATGDDFYLNELKSRYQRRQALEFSWDDKTAGVQVLLAELTGLDEYKTDVEAFMEHAMSKVKKTPDGMTWLRKWGPNRYAGGYAAIAMFAAALELPKSQEYRDYAESQIHYLLGENQRKSSYVIGIGQNPPQRPHHRASSCPSWDSLPVDKCTWGVFNSPSANPHVLFGALVGGPDENGNYEDDRSDYIANEVALDYNAGFQAAVAGLEFFNIEDDLS